MLKKSVLMFMVLLMFGCEQSSTHTISAPDGSKCLTLEYTNSLNPEHHSVVKLYYGSEPVNQQFATMKWSSIGSISVDWGSKPIKIRSLLLVENTIPDSLVNFEKHMSEEETAKFHEQPTDWKAYDFTHVHQGKYKSCK